MSLQHMARILTVSTPFPFPINGASASDRAHGILQFLRLGFKVKLITQIAKNEQLKELLKRSDELGIEIVPLVDRTGTSRSFAKRMTHLALRLLKNPLLIDGAASEFDNPEIKKALHTQMEHWRPDIVWFERSYTWPLYKIVKRYNVPIATRSHNFEPVDFLEDHETKPWDYLRIFARLLSEIQTVRGSDVIFPITEREVQLYKRIGAKNIAALPLRGLPYFLQQTSPIKTSGEKRALNVFFMGSTYKVRRNKKALRFVLEDAIPRVQSLDSESFQFHIFGEKFPHEYKPFLAKNVIYRGYVDDLDSALAEMDIALAPYLQKGRPRGMQQKIFEPLARGFPTVTSKNGLAGYPFENEKHLLFAESAEDFARQLVRLKDQKLRTRIATGAKEHCQKLFSQERLDSIVLTNIAKYL